MDKMEKMMQQILAQWNTTQEKAEASMAKFLEEEMDAKMDSYQEKAEASMAKLKERMKEIMEAFLTKIDAIRGKTTA
jgi:hypothetical protein